MKEKREEKKHRLKTLMHLEPLTLLLGAGWPCQCGG